MHPKGENEFTGFPSLAGEYSRLPLDIHTFLVRNPLSTFFVRFEGDAMIEENIFDQDTLIIERLPRYRDGDIVLVFVEGERLVRRLEKQGNRFRLCPGNKRYRAIDMNEDMQVFGRVIHSVTHHLRVSQLPALAR
jgi:DNA polymerase V